MIFSLLYDETQTRHKKKRLLGIRLPFVFHYTTSSYQKRKETELRMSIFPLKARMETELNHLRLPERVNNHLRFTNGVVAS